MTNRRSIRSNNFPSPSFPFPHEYTIVQEKGAELVKCLHEDHRRFLVEIHALRAVSAATASALPVFLLPWMEWSTKSKRSICPARPRWQLRLGPVAGSSLQGSVRGQNCLCVGPITAALGPATDPVFSLFTMHNAFIGTVYCTFCNAKHDSLFHAAVLDSRIM